MPADSVEVSTTPSHAEEAVHDRPALLTLVGDDEELLNEIVALFLREYPRLLGGIHAALASGDVQALQFSAHALKGSVGNMAAPRTLRAAMDLEAIARADRLPAAGEALATLERELSHLHIALTGPVADPTR